MGQLGGEVFLFRTRVTRKKAKGGGYRSRDLVGGLDWPVPTSKYKAVGRCDGPPQSIFEVPDGSVRML